MKVLEEQTVSWCRRHGTAMALSRVDSRRLELLYGGMNDGENAHGMGRLRF